MTPLALEKIIEAMFDLSGVDGVHPKEMVLIRNVVKGMWPGTEESLKDFLMTTQKNMAANYRPGGSKMAQEFEKKLDELVPMIEGPDIEVCHDLIKSVINSDDQVSPEEIELYKMFKTKLKLE